jgi:hypothetical protein
MLNMKGKKEKNELLVDDDRAPSMIINDFRVDD